MNYKATAVLSLAICGLFLSGCFHSQTHNPPGHCHKLRTQLNTNSHMNPALAGHQSNPATRSSQLREYQALGCED